MSVPVAFFDRLQLAHQIGREIVEAFDHPDMISDAVKLVASRLECMGVGITFLNHSDRVLSIFAEDYGQSPHTTQKPAEILSSGR